jgi:hypothetical protein
MKLEEIIETVKHDLKYFEKAETEFQAGRAWEAGKILDMLKMENCKIDCLDIEIAIMRFCDIRRNIIVPCVTDMSYLINFETDVLVVSPSGYATGFEIKTSLSDLRNDLKKPHIFKLTTEGNHAKERYFRHFKYFNYAVSKDLVEHALKQIPPFCGLYSFEYINGWPTFKQERPPERLFNNKWDESKIFKLAKLGTMRLLGLKQALNFITKNRGK